MQFCSQIKKLKMRSIKTKKPLVEHKTVNDIKTLMI